MPFTFGDVQLLLGHQRLDLLTCSTALLEQARGGSLTFTTQKNGITNEVIRLNRSGDSFLCPVLAIIRRVLHLCWHNAPPHTPLARVFTPTGVQHVTPFIITKTLVMLSNFLVTTLVFSHRKSLQDHYKWRVLWHS